MPKSKLKANDAFCKAWLWNNLRYNSKDQYVSLNHFLEDIFVDLLYTDMYLSVFICIHSKDIIIIIPIILSITSKNAQGGFTRPSVLVCFYSCMKTQTLITLFLSFNYSIVYSEMAKLIKNKHTFIVLFYNILKITGSLLFDEHWHVMSTMYT